MKKTYKRVTINNKPIAATSPTMKNTMVLLDKGFVRIKYTAQNTYNHNNSCLRSSKSFSGQFTEQRRTNTPKVNYIYTGSTKNLLSSKSIKPANIVLDIKKLMLTALSLCFNISSLPQHAIFLVFQGLSSCAEIKNVLTVRIDKEEALVMIALWKEAKGKKISVDDGLKAVNEFCKKTDEREFSNKIYQKVLDRLCKIKSIVIEEDIIILKEQVSKKLL